MATNEDQTLPMKKLGENQIVPVMTRDVQGAIPPSVLDACKKSMCFSGNFGETISQDNIAFRVINNTVGHPHTVKGTTTNTYLAMTTHYEIELPDGQKIATISVTVSL